MDREVVEQKLESLRRCLQRIESKCSKDINIYVIARLCEAILYLNLDMP